MGSFLFEIFKIIIYLMKNRLATFLNFRENESKLNLKCQSFPRLLSMKKQFFFS